MRDFERPPWPARVAAAVVLIRILVGWIFLSEGVQKFLFHGETFIIHPGEVLVAEDHTGSGHKWGLINDEPWKTRVRRIQAGRGHALSRGFRITRTRGKYD